MIYSGIDEAGLGPILGPYCATSVTFSSNYPLKDYLKDIQKKLFYVDDSKKVYQGKFGLKKLEENVLSFYYVLNKVLPNSSLDFIPSLQSPWNKLNPIQLPITANKYEIKQKANNILELLKLREIELLDIKRTAISAINFNNLLDTYNNKGVVCQKIIEPLIYNVVNFQNTNKQKHNVVIDKQGGRKFYLEYLNSILKTSVFINKEEDNHSVYSLNNTKINFLAKADSLDFSTALSSMFSKYMREIAMLSFNRYWNNLIPDIKPTAGYYTDGMRFINKLVENNLYPKNSDLILRKK